MAGRRPNGPRCGSSSTANGSTWACSASIRNPDRLLGNTMKRDEDLLSDDRFMWTIDTFLDQQSGYLFEMNPVGAHGRLAHGLRYPRQQGLGRDLGRARAAQRNRLDDRDRDPVPHTELRP